MNQKKTKLGRGLESLLSAQAGFDVENNTRDKGELVSGLKQLPLESISRSPYQPRKEFDTLAIEELAHSIQHQGLMQPIVVRKIANGYELIAGERRWRACQHLQMDTISALVRQVDDEAAIAMALIENIQREDLNAMEQAIALNNLKNSYELTHAEVAQAVGKSRVAVTNLLRLLSLRPEVQTLLENGDLEMGHARALLRLKIELQIDAAEQVIAKGLSVRQTEAMVKRLTEAGTKSNKIAEDPDVERLMERLSEQIGVPVKITQTSKGKGKLVLSYSTLDELDGIIAKINQ